MRRVTDRRGYITLEASLILPVLILAVLALGYYIRIFAVMENVSYSMMEETALLASRAYVTESAPLFEEKLNNRITEDNPEVEALKITKTRYLYHDGDLDDLISVRAEYRIDTDIPLGLDHTVELTSQVKCRGFKGSEKTGTPMSFEEMETEGVWDSVWIFPSSGEKYHGEACTHVTANARQMVLTGTLKKRYDPCKLCDADKAAVGSYVYCFTDNGTAYHLENCRQVTRYTIEINRDEAIGKGFVPCSKCGGG